MGKESSSRRRRVASGAARADDLQEIFQPNGDGTFTPKFVAKDVAEAFEAQQALLNSAPKITDEDQFRLAENLGLGLTEDGRANCIPGYQYRGADGRCKARPADAFGNINQQAGPITFSDGLTTKLYHNDRIVTLPTLPGAFPGGPLGGAFGGGFNGAGGVIGAGAERFGPIQSGRAVDPDDNRVKSWREGFPGAKWQTYNRNFNPNCGDGNYPTPNGGCISGQDMFKDGWSKALYGPTNRVVAQPYQTSFTDMTNMTNYPRYGEARAAYAVQPNPYNPYEVPRRAAGP